MYCKPGRGLHGRTFHDVGVVVLDLIPAVGFGLLLCTRLGGVKGGEEGTIGGRVRNIGVGWTAGPIQWQELEWLKPFGQHDMGLV